MDVPDDDGALDALDHDGLVAYLNGLYASAGELPLSDSAAKASTDDELRAAIRVVCRRQAQRQAGAARLSLVPARSARVLDRGAGGTPRRASYPDRALCVLATADESIIARARALMRSRGFPLVVADRPEVLARVLVSVTPTHLVIETALGEIQICELLGVRTEDVRVYWSDSGEATIAALAIVT